MSYSQKNGYLIKDTQVKIIKKFLPQLIKGNMYENPSGSNGYFVMKSFRKYTWSPPESNHTRYYDYHVELEFYGTVTLWGTTYDEIRYKRSMSYRKKSIHRQLKSLAENLIVGYLKILDSEIPQHSVHITKVTLKTNED